MGDHQSLNFYNILGINKAASIRDVCKAYKSLVMRWHPDKNPESNKSEAETKFKIIKEAFEALSDKKQEDGNLYGVHDYGGCGWGFYKHRSLDNFFSSTPSPLSKSVSRRSHTPTPVPRSLTKSMSGRSTTSTTFPTSLSKSMSQRSTTPIMFSQSTARRKSPPIEKRLECTLEELCHGCVKKIKITRDVLTNTGTIVQEEELLRIKVKPGWNKGTKITFEGMGNERPGILPADITFLIAEKQHPLFKRDGNDLLLPIEIPLVKALTGCTLSIPLLDGETMSLSFDDIIYPGYEKIISGQGMPDTKERGRRGDLRIKFLINFPVQLSEEQRSDIRILLQHCS